MFWSTSTAEAWRAVSSAKRATISSVLIMAVSLAILGILGLGALAFHNEAQTAKRWITAEVFLKDGLEPEAIQLVRRRIVAIEGVSNARLITKAEALVRFKRFFGSELVDVLETNPLPQSYLLTLSDEGRTPEGLKAIARKAGSFPEVESVDADVEWLTILERISFTVNVVLLLFLGTVGFAISVVISRTIGLGIASRAEVVTLQRLLGASEWFVRRPFVILGVAQGAVGGILAALIVLACSRFAYAIPLVGRSFGGTNAHVAAWSLVGVGVVLGLAGSISTLRSSLPRDPWESEQVTRNSLC